MCPVTSQAKGYPFEVTLPARTKVVGVILADQVRSVDWRARRAQRAGRLSADVMTRTLGLIRTLL